MAKAIQTQPITVSVFLCDDGLADDDPALHADLMADMAAGDHIYGYEVVDMDQSDMEDHHCCIYGHEALIEDFQETMAELARDYGKARVVLVEAGYPDGTDPDSLYVRILDTLGGLADLSPIPATTA